MKIKPTKALTFVIVLTVLLLSFGKNAQAVNLQPLLSGIPPATIRYVKPAASGTGDCSSWVNACTLQTALGVAVATNEIRVSAGTYMPTTTTDRSISFSLKNGVPILGGYPDGGGDVRNWLTNVTILSGAINSTADTDNSFHVVTSNSNTSNAILDGFTITKGYADNGDFDSDYIGGGIYLLSSSPTLRNLKIIDNEASNSGAGIYNSMGNPTITGVTIEGNSANSGAGMFNDDGAPSLTSISFISNQALSTGGGMQNEYSDVSLTTVSFSNNSAGSSHGGGMANLYTTTSTLSNVTFTNNTSGNSGGGMYNESSNASLSNVTFNGNSAVYGGGMMNKTCNPTLNSVTFQNNTASTYGGGMYNETSNGSLTDVTFSSNVANLHGGGMLNSASSPVLNQVSFIHNTATNEEGGGIYNSTGTAPELTDVTFDGNIAGTFGGGAQNYTSNAKYTNVTFSNNSAGNGGGLSLFIGAHPVLQNVTFSGNHASGNGGAIYNYAGSLTTRQTTIVLNTAGNAGGGIFSWQSDTSSCTTTMVSSIVWGNLPQANQITNGSGCYSAITYCDIEGGWTITPTGNLNLNPLLGPLADNGGFTMTHALFHGSPAIDTANQYTYTPTDQRGFARPYDGNGDGVALPDMGAYESEFSHGVYLSIVFR